MTRNALYKLIIATLAHAPALALDSVLAECKNDEEREEARRIFKAVGVKKNDTRNSDIF